MQKKLDNIWAGIVKLSAESPLKLAILVFAFSFLAIFSISISHYDAEFFENILVEAHGMLLDLLILGIFLVWLNSLGERRRNIQRYREEIEDYLGWQEPEATFRIVGNIKRLNREGITKIHLHNAYLAKADLHGVDLSGSRMSLADLSNANLVDAILTNTNLFEANLSNAWLAETNLEGAELLEADLRGASLDKANLRGAGLSGADYNGKTRWPEGFDPKVRGAIMNDE